MTIVRGNVVLAEGNPVTSLVVNVPTGLVDTDVLITFLGIGTAGLTPPSGWTLLGQATGQPVINSYVYYHIVTSATGEPASYTWSGWTSTRATAMCAGYSGVDNGTPVDVTASTLSNAAGATTLVLPSITTVTDGAMLISCAGQDSAVGTDTIPGSMVRVSDSTGTGKRFGSADELFGTAGATGTRTWTFDSAALAHSGVLGALRPTAAAPPPVGDLQPPRLPPWLLYQLIAAKQQHADGVSAPVEASGTPAALVVSPPYFPAPPGPAQLFAAPNQPGAPAALVVTPPFAPIPVPGAQISASQPLGNPAVGSPQPLVISTAWTAQVPGAILSANPAAPVVSTTATPQPLVVSPPYQPVPLLAVRISSSQPLGNPAVGTPSPYVVTTTWTAKVPGAQLFANPAAPVVSATSTPNALVVTPAPGVVLVPGARLFAGSPNTVSARPLVVSMPFVRQPVPGARIVSNPLVPPAQRTFAPVLVVTTPWISDRGGVLLSRGTEPGAAVSCQLPRPSSGTTARPGTGITARPVATTLRPGSGVTLRPDTGNTDNPC